MSCYVGQTLTNINCIHCILSRKGNRIKCFIIQYQNNAFSQQKNKNKEKENE